MEKVDYLTSFNAIEERLKSSHKVLALFYAKESEGIKTLIALARKRHIKTELVPSAELKLIGAGQCALAIPPEERGGQKWLDKKLEKLATKPTAFVVVLDGVTDVHNLGAILRSATLFNVDLVLYGERRSAQGDTDTIMRTSAGAANIIAHGAVSNINRALSALKTQGFWVYGSAMQGQKLHNIQPADKKVLVLGSEGNGLSALSKKNCDVMLSIATNNKLDSLNVSVAAGILMYSLQTK
jgi:23S rRNA (guanosine2251-2'-O)-methyltransferase